MRGAGGEVNEIRALAATNLKSNVGLQRAGFPRAGHRAGTFKRTADFHK